MIEVVNVAWSETPDGKDVVWVSFKEDPMTYHCAFDRNGRMTRPADSIAKLGRVAEFEFAYREYAGLNHVFVSFLAVDVPSVKVPGHIHRRGTEVAPVRRVVQHTGPSLWVVSVRVRNDAGDFWYEELEVKREDTALLLISPDRYHKALDNVLDAVSDLRFSDEEDPYDDPSWDHDLGSFIVGYWGGTPESDEYPDPQDMVDPDWDPEERALVIQHLKNGREAMNYMGFAKCRICGCRLGSRDITDNDFKWPEKLEHYLEEHNVRLPQRFVRHVLTTTSGAKG